VSIKPFSVAWLVKSCNSTVFFEKILPDRRKSLRMCRKMAPDRIHNKVHSKKDVDLRAFPLRRADLFQNLHNYSH
jgi:hypothetical protein